jgi:uncharacterized protein (TIGR03435 family)
MTIQSRLATIAVCLAAAARFADAQSAPVPQFEAASLKPSPKWNGELSPPIPAFKGGPGTTTPTRFTVRNYLLRQLILWAYGLKGYQLSAPAWLESMDFLNSDKVDIDATLAPGATKEQFLVMLRNLLVDRFGLRTHREQREVPIFALVIGKVGRHLKENTEADLSSEFEGSLPANGPDGFPAMPPGYTGMFVHVSGDRIRLKYMRYSMPKFADGLWLNAGRPVVDRTGLRGNYDFFLEFRREPPESATEPGDAPDIHGAIQQQLGLKLAPDKGTIDMLVIDHAGRVPSAN